MKKILYFLTVFFFCTATQAEKPQKISGTIHDYGCGDNCYLTIKNKQGQEIYGLCAAPTCSAWNEYGEMPEKFKGRRVEITLGKRKRFDGSGNVMDKFMSFEKIKFLNQSKATSD